MKTYEVIYTVNDIPFRLTARGKNVSEVYSIFQKAYEDAKIVSVKVAR